MKTKTYIRIYINNKFITLINKLKCEDCGCTNNLIIHHTKENYFDGVFHQFIRDLKLENYNNK